MTSPDQEPRELTLSLLFDLFVANQQVRQLVAASMTDAGMSPDEYAIYSALFEFGALSPTELGRTVGMPPTTVSHYVRTLRERGHVEEEPNSADHRSFRMSLSPSGLAAQRRAGRAFNQAYDRFLARLDDPARAKAALDDLRQAAGEAHRDLLADAQEAAG